MYKNKKLRFVAKKKLSFDKSFLWFFNRHTRVTHFLLVKIFDENLKIKY